MIVEKCHALHKLVDKKCIIDLKTCPFSYVSELNFHFWSPRGAQQPPITYIVLPQASTAGLEATIRFHVPLPQQPVVAGHCTSACPEVTPLSSKHSVASMASFSGEMRHRLICLEASVCRLLFVFFIFASIYRSMDSRKILAQYFIFKWKVGIMFKCIQNKLC